MIIDTSQISHLANTLATLPVKKKLLVKAAVKKGAQNIKEEILKDVQSSSNKGFRRIPIEYQIIESGNTVEADISPAKVGRGKGHPGSLANLAFFGTARGGGTHQFYEHGISEFPQTVKYVQLAAKGLR